MSSGNIIAFQFALRLGRVWFFFHKQGLRLTFETFCSSSVKRCVISMRLNTQKIIASPDPALIQLINQIFLSLGLILSLAKQKNA